MDTNNKGYNLKIQINNNHLSYNDVGEGSTPIIFLHGYPFDKTVWEDQLYNLKSSYRLISCDIRGFGKYTYIQRSINNDIFADEFIQFMDKLSIDKAIVCGLSMGEYIALNAMQRFPERFEALVLCDTHCIADTMEAL